MNIFTIKNLNTILCASFFSTLIISPESYKHSAISLSLIALLLSWKSRNSFKNKIVKYLSFSFILYFSITLASVIYYSSYISQIDIPSRTILGMLTLAMLVKFGFNEKWIFWAIPVGSFLSGIYALYFFFILGERPFLYHGYMVIQTGGMCALLGTLSAVIYFYAINKKYIWLERVALWSASFGMIATLLSGARGAWVLTPFVLLGLIWHFKTTLNKQRILTLLVHSIVIIGISLPQIHSRTNEAAEELTDYNQAQISIQTNTEQENLIEKDQPKNSTHTNTETRKLANYNQPQKNTSLGIRIELWKSAIYSFIEKPIIGQGLNNIEESKRIQIEQGLVDPLVLNSTRAHNQFLEEMQTKGLIGLTALLTLFFVPLLTFRKLYNKNKHNYFALMGEVHVILIMGFCLTQHYLNHHSGLLVFTFGTVILASAALKKEGDTIRDEFS